jgi:hypothetical protein
LKKISKLKKELRFYCGGRDDEVLTSKVRITLIFAICKDKGRKKYFEFWINLLLPVTILWSAASIVVVIWKRM